MDNSILIAIFIVVFIVGISATYIFAKTPAQPSNTTTTTTIPASNATVMSAEEVGVRAVAYLNKYFQQQGTQTTLISSAKEGDVYHLRFDISNKTYDSYATVDGKLLFPSALDMSAG